MVQARPWPLQIHWLIIIAVVAAVYGRSLAFDFIQDDYYLLRPWSSAELASVFHGPWDPKLWEPVFYRPLCTAWYAAMFWLFGLNATAIHFVSLVIVTALTLLLRSVVVRETGSHRLGLFGGVLLLLHPALSVSSVVWATSQHVFLGMICAVIAVRTWQWCRSGPDRRWLALIPPLAAGMMFREDVVLVAPALLVAQFARARLVGDVPAPRLRLVGRMGAILALAFALRYWLLGGLGGYGWIVIEDLHNAWRQGPRHALLTPAPGTPGAIAAAAVMTVGFIVGSIVLWRRGEPRLRALWTLGIAAMLSVNFAQFQFPAPMRFGLMTTLATLALTAAAGALGQVILAHAGRVVAGVVIAAALLPLAHTSRYAYSDRWSCNSLQFEVEMANEPVTTPDIRAFLLDLPRQCAGQTFVRLNESAPVLAWGLAAPGAEGIRRMSEQAATWLITPSATTTRFKVRATDASSGPSSVRFRTDAGDETTVRLNSTEWREVAIPLRSSWLTRLRARHRLDMDVDGGLGSMPAVELSPLLLTSGLSGRLP